MTHYHLINPIPQVEMFYTLSTALTGIIQAFQTHFHDFSVDYLPLQNWYISHIYMLCLLH